MGIQINGQTDTISAGDGGLVVNGAELPTVTNINASGIGTFGSGVVLTGGDITLGTGVTASGTTANTFTVSTNGSERLRVDSSGRLGIGTISAESIYYNVSTPYTPGVQIKGSYPQGGLAINCTNDAAQLWLVNSQNSTTSDRGYGAITFLGYNSTDNKYQTAARIDGIADATTGSDDMPGRLVFSTTADGASTPTERMTIDSTGKVQMGTSSDTNVNSRLVVYQSDNVNSTRIIVENPDLGDSRAALLEASGNCAGGSQRRAYLAVEKRPGLTNPVAIIAMAPQDGQYNYIWVDDANQLRISTSNANSGTTGGTVVGTQTSDERLKNILGPVTYGLNTVKQIEPVRYTLKDEPDIEKIGFIAQQVLPVVPESVFDTKQEIEGGEEGDPTQLGMEYVSLIPVLINAIKELSAEVDTLKAQLQTP